MSDSSHVHAEVEPLLGPLALGLLEGDERRRVLRHLDTCPACAAELASLTGVADLLSVLTAEQAATGDPASMLPPPGLGDDVVAAIGAEHRRSRLRARVLAVAAAGVVVLGVGAAAALGLSEDDQAPAGPTVVAIGAVQSDSGVTASAGYVAHTWGLELKLRTAGLTTGGAYDVEVVDRAGRESTAGAFVGTGAKPMDCNLNSGVLAPDVAAFVVRDASGAEVVRGTL